MPSAPPYERVAWNQVPPGRLDVPMPPDQAAWRAIVADAQIVRCHGVEILARDANDVALPTCDRRWRTAEPTTDPLVRRCPIDGGRGCGASIHYCTSLADANAAGVTCASIVLDPGLDAADALRAYDIGAADPRTGDDEFSDDGPVIGHQYATPPVEPPVGPPDAIEANPSLWSRVRGWFRR